MHDEVTICAVNNAHWCDTVCRAHGLSGAFTSAIWIQPRVGPPYYPNAVTLSLGQLEDQCAVVADLKAVLPSGFAVKDSFSRLELAKTGFKVAFDAEWIWLDLSPVRSQHSWSRPSWASVRKEAELERWEDAWALAGSPTSSRIFLPGLLRDPSIAFLCAVHGGQIVAGCVANRSAESVGFSNFFAPTVDREVYRAAAIGAVARFAPGLPVVGYERGEELARSVALGFRSVGWLRVWVPA